MNIFRVDNDPIVAARMLCNRHVVKMVLETAQMLSTINGGPYKPTHANHPCTLWAKASKCNYAWLALHGLALCDEYTARYSKRHKCEDIIEQLSAIPESIEPLACTPQPLCMPDEYKRDSIVESYRAYYRGDKAYFATWPAGLTPEWFDAKALSSL